MICKRPSNSVFSAPIIPTIRQMSVHVARMGHSQAEKVPLREGQNIATQEGRPMYALIAIGVVVALFAVLNLIDYRRLD